MDGYRKPSPPPSDAHSNDQTIIRGQDLQENRRTTVKFVGRKISLGECEFIFERVWRLTVESRVAEKKAGSKELSVPVSKDGQAQGAGPATMNNSYVQLSDLFHIIDLCGTLLNKKEPDEEDQTPCEEFFKYAQARDAEESGRPGRPSDSVDIEDMPKILFAVFAG